MHIRAFSFQCRSSYQLRKEEATCRTRNCLSSAEKLHQRCLAARWTHSPGNWIAAVSWVQMAMKKCASHPNVLYAQSEEWSKDKCGQGWCWISSDTECPGVPCSMHHKSTNMNIQNMHIEKNILHILHILPGAEVCPGLRRNTHILHIQHIQHILIIHVPHNLEECHESSYQFCR
jgi:hypothetical protein